VWFTRQPWIVVSAENDASQPLKLSRKLNEDSVCARRRIAG
jgi:hypothetical protein